MKLIKSIRKQTFWILTSAILDHDKNRAGQVCQTHWRIEQIEIKQFQFLIEFEVSSLFFSCISILQSLLL